MWSWLRDTWKTAALAGAILLLLGGATFAGMGRLARGGDVAAGVQRGAAVQELKEELAESAAEMMRRECLRRPFNPACADVLGIEGATRGRPSAAAPIRGVLPADGVDVTGRFGAGNLLRDDGPNGLGWRSTTASLPQELRFELREPVVVARAAFRHTLASIPESWAREVELLLSEAAPDSGFVSVGRWALRWTTSPQEFSFRPAKARYARLRVLSRHGDADFVSIGAFALGMATPDQAPLLRP